MFTKAEAQQVASELGESVFAIGDVLDEALSRFNRAAADAEIWSTLDEEDAEVLAKAATRYGRRYATAAELVRRADEIGIGAQVVMIVVPRIFESIEFALEHGLGIPSKAARAERRARHAAMTEMLDAAEDQGE